MAKANIVALTVADVEQRLQSIAVLAGKVLFVSDEDELADKLKAGVSYPAAAVVYEGMQSMPEAKESHRVGLTSEMVIMICLVNRPSALVSSDTKVPSLQILTDIREKMKDSRSPTGHFWRFVVEAPVKNSNGIAFWIQRWSCPVQL